MPVSWWTPYFLPVAQSKYNLLIRVMDYQSLLSSSVSILSFFFAIASGVQVLFLVLCSEVIPGGVWGTQWGALDQTLDSCMHDKYYYLLGPSSHILARNLQLLCFFVLCYFPLLGFSTGASSNQGLSEPPSASCILLPVPLTALLRVLKELG